MIFSAPSSFSVPRMGCSITAALQLSIYLNPSGTAWPVACCQAASNGMEKYLVPADAELDDLRTTGILMDEIHKFFGWIESKQVMFFIDSCYSGEAGGRTFQNPLFKGRHLLSAEFLEDLASEGRLVVTACDVNEVSLETPDMGHGLFTYYLMEGLKGVADKDQDALVTIHELYDYVYGQVSQHARKMGGSMHPIQKGSAKGKIFLTQYETAAQNQAKPLHAQAQTLFKAGKFDEAYELWQQIIELVPNHAGAKQGLADIENMREEKRRQEDLERKQSILLALYHEGRLPSNEFARGGRGVSVSTMAAVITSSSATTTTCVLCARDNRFFDSLSFLILLNRASGFENFLKVDLPLFFVLQQHIEPILLEMRICGENIDEFLFGHDLE